MPHKCVSCGQRFDDGAEEVLSGCSRCGSRKFEFVRQTTEPSSIEGSSNKTPVENSTSVSSEPPEQAAARNTVADIAISPPQRTDGQDATGMTSPSEEVVESPSQIRKELNQQFEGVRVAEPGKYELDLENIFRSGVTIVSLSDDGRYSIKVHSTDG